MNLDKFFFAVYDRRSYNCAHFAIDVWREVTGQDLTGRMEVFVAMGRTKVTKRGHTFTRILAPESPCLVLVNQVDGLPHLGVFLNSKMIHLRETGAEFMPLLVACTGAKRVRFYTCKL